MDARQDQHYNNGGFQGSFDNLNHQPTPPAYQTGSYNTSTVVVTQPSPTTTAVVVVPDSMGLAIFACLCCCWPIGMVAICKASEAKDAISRGDATSAITAARQSRLISLVAIGAGVLFIIIIIIYAVVTVVNASNAVTSNSNSY